MAQFRFNLELLLSILALAGSIAVGVSAIVWFRHWQRAQQATSSATRLEDFRALMEQGLLEPAEYERIREQLEKRPAPDPIPPPASPAGPNALQNQVTPPPPHS